MAGRVEYCGRDEQERKKENRKCNKIKLLIFFFQSKKFIDIMFALLKYLHEFYNQKWPNR